MNRQTAGMADNRKHVCLVSGAHLWRNPRLVKEADALAEAGMRVSVVCASLNEEDRIRDEALMVGRPWRRILAPDLLRPTPLSLNRNLSRLSRRLSIVASRRLGLRLTGSLG